MIIISLITIFTPTFNRKEKLKRCYESLLNQTSKKFIWQVVDDGSTDDTENLVKEWIAQDILEIIYIKKENGGKASSINVSLSNTDTDLWLTLDSDDYLFDNAIEIIIQKYTEIIDSPKTCGMFGLRSFPNGEPMQNKQMPKELKYTTQNHIRYNLGIPPEYYHVYKTEIIKQFPYPIIDGENYFPLSYVFDQIDQKYKYLVIHESVMICEYQSDGMTNNKRKLIERNPKGYTLYKKQLAEFAPDFETKAKASANYITGSLLSKERNWLRKSPNVLLTILMFPIGLLDYLIRYKLNIRIDFE